MTTQIIGDEIHHNGYLVGMLVSNGVPPSVLEGFAHELDNGTLFEVETDDAEEPDKPAETDTDESAYDAALDDVQRAAKEFAKGGLLRLADLARIVTQLKEETP